MSMRRYFDISSILIHIVTITKLGLFGSYNSHTKSTNSRQCLKPIIYAAGHYRQNPRDSLVSLIHSSSPKCNSCGFKSEICLKRS